MVSRTTQNLRDAANHEAGHAMAEYALHRMKKLQKIAIFNDGSGYTAFNIPLENMSRAHDLMISMAGALEESRYKEKRFSLNFIWSVSPGDAMAVEDRLYMMPPEHSLRMHPQVPWSFRTWAEKTRKLLEPYNWHHAVLTMKLLEREDVSARMAKQVLREWEQKKAAGTREWWR